MPNFDEERLTVEVARQANLINARVFEAVYPELDYAALVPVDFTGPEWLPSRPSIMTDTVGKAEWIAERARDVPNVELVAGRTEIAFHTAAAGYEIWLGEVQQAALYGVNVSDRKGLGVRRAYDEFLYELTISGSAPKGVYGLINNPAVTAGNAPAGTGGTTWATKTPAEIAADVDAVLTGMGAATNYVEIADTLLLPADRFSLLARTLMPNAGNVTLLEHILRTNRYTQRTRRELTIRELPGLETAGAGGTHRMVAYRRDPTVVALNVPMPLAFQPPYRASSLHWHVAAVFRTSGLEIVRPAAFRYLDAI